MANACGTKFPGGIKYKTVDTVGVNVISTNFDDININDQKIVIARYTVFYIFAISGNRKTISNTIFRQETLRL